MDETSAGPDTDPIEPKRLLFLGLCTTALAVVFTVLVIGDTVSAMTF